MKNYSCFYKDGNTRSDYFLDRVAAEGYWEDDKIYSVTESYEFYKDYNRTRENLDEVDWDIVSVQLDYADIDFIREFKDLIRWDLVDNETYIKWKNNDDKRFKEFGHLIEDTEITDKSLDDEWYVKDFVKRLMEK